MARPSSMKSLALQFLLAHAGEVITREQIETYVRSVRGTMSAGEVTRRIRDLRRDGWQIRTRNDESGLSAGAYRLASVMRGEPIADPEQRTLTSLLTEILARSEMDQWEICELLKRRLGS